MQNQSLTPLFEKKRELEAQITVLISKIEMKARDFNLVAEASTDVRQQIIALNKMVASINTMGEEAIQAVESLIEQATRALAEANQATTESLSFLKTIEALIVQRIDELHTVEKTSKARLEEIKREGQVLEKTRSDIEVYVQRLQKKYDEMGMGKLLL